MKIGDLFSKKYNFIIQTNQWRDLWMHLGIFMSLIVIVVLFIFNTYLPASTHHNETVTVPDLVGMNTREVEEFLNSRDLDFEIRDSSFSKKHKPGVVLTQSPSPGEKVKRNRKLFLTVNPFYPPKIKMPKIVDLTFASALQNLRNADLELGRIKYKPHVGKDVVLEQWVNNKPITPGALVAKGTKIDLLVGDGLGEKEFPVPNVIGMPLDEAEILLQGSDLVVGTINYIYKSSREIGTVLRQNPPVYVGKRRRGVKEGSMMDDRERNKVRAGEIIDLWVAGNPAAKPQNDSEEEEEDSLLTNINQRYEKDIKSYQDKHKKTEDKKQNKNNPKPEIKKDVPKPENQQ